MRRLGMAVAAVLLCATMGFARENRNNVSKEPFAINFEKLSNYLQLSSYQANEVANINEYFLDMQGESLRASEKMRDKKMRQAVYGNLKLMKEGFYTGTVSQICGSVECDKITITAL